MRVFVILGAAVVTLSSSALASPLVSSEDAQLMRIEALADRAPDRIQGSAPYIFESPDTAVDLTNGQNVTEPDDCSRVPVLTKRSDEKTISQRIDMCD